MPHRRQARYGRAQRMMHDLLAGIAQNLSHEWRLRLISAVAGVQPDSCPGEVWQPLITRSRAASSPPRRAIRHRYWRPFVWHIMEQILPEKMPNPFGVRISKGIGCGGAARQQKIARPVMPTASTLLNVLMVRFSAPVSLSVSDASQKRRAADASAKRR